jgi:hypothetical protein
MILTKDKGMPVTGPILLSSDQEAGNGWTAGRGVLCVSPLSPSGFADCNKRHVTPCAVENGGFHRLVELLSQQHGQF